MPPSRLHRTLLATLALLAASAFGGVAVPAAGATEPCVEERAAATPRAWTPTGKYTCWPGGDKQRTTGGQEALARSAMGRLWERAAPLLDADPARAPRLRFVSNGYPKPSPSAVMWVGPDEAGQRTIFINPGQRRALAKRSGNWRTHYAGLTRALHETAHYFQSDAVLFDDALRESGASDWARAHGPLILGTQAKRRTVVADEWRDRGQFEGNLGGDAPGFGWPGVPLS